MLIQAFLVMDIAWAAGGSLDISNQAAQSATLAPKLNLNTEEILNSYIYRVNLSEISPQLKDIGISSKPSLNQSESRSFLTTAGKTLVQTIIIAATVLTFSGLWSTPAVATRTVNLSDIVVSVNKADLDKYTAIIQSQDVQYTIEESSGQPIIRITGLFPLNAEKLADSLNAKALVRDLAGSFSVTSSESNWEQSQTYGFMQYYADEVANISAELGFEKIDSLKLMPLYEGVTRVESNFKQWKLDAEGKIVLLESYTNAKGVTQVIESQAVEELARLIVSHKGGIAGYTEIIDELERMISSDREKLSKAIKQGKQVIEETEEIKQFNVYNEFIAYKTANSAKEKKQLIKKIHTKINNNPKLVTVNLYYALAVWEYLQKNQNLQVGVNPEIAGSMGKIGQELNIESESGGYRPVDFEKAGLQFERDYFRAKLINKMLDKEKIDALLQNNEGKTLDKVMEYLSQQMMQKIGNQKLGYTYLTLNWDRYRRLELSKIKKNKYEFIEKSLSYFKDNPHGFSVELATVASYNAGSGSIDTALLNFGDAVDERHVPIWIKNMVGANPNNVREPIDYLCTYLADRSIHHGDLTQANENIKNQLILERYKRIYKVKGGFLQKRDLIIVDGVKQYKYYNRTDNFNYKLAALFAQVAGIDYVNKFLGSYGLGEKWEEKIFSSSQTFEILASVLADNTSARFKAAKALKRRLNSPEQVVALAAAEQNLKSKERARIARIELAKQMAEKEQWRNIKAKIKNWAMGLAIMIAVISVVGVIVDYMKRRVKQGKQAVPAPVYRIPLQVLGVTVWVLLISGKIIIKAFKLFLGKEKSKATKIGKRSSPTANTRVFVKTRPRNNFSLRQQRVSFLRKLVNTTTRSGLPRERFFSVTFFIGISLAQFVDPGDSFAGTLSNMQTYLNTGNVYIDILMLSVALVLSILLRAILKYFINRSEIKKQENQDIAEEKLNQGQKDISFSDEEWMNILVDKGLQDLNIEHTRRNVSAVNYFAVKENLNQRQKEILKAALWLHDISKDNSLDEYIPENKKLSGVFRLLVHHFEGAEYAEKLLTEKGYDSDFVSQVKNIILTHMGPIRGKNRKGFMEFLSLDNIDAISSALEESAIRGERKEKLKQYVTQLRTSGFAAPKTDLEEIARDIDFLDLSGIGLVKVVFFRQTDPSFFLRVNSEDEIPQNQLQLLYANNLIKGYEDSWRFADNKTYIIWNETTIEKLSEKLKNISGADLEAISALWDKTKLIQETIEASFLSAMMTADDVGANLLTATAGQILTHRLNQLNLLKTNVDLRKMKDLPPGIGKPEKFQDIYNEFMSQAKLFYDAVLEGTSMPQASMGDAVIAVEDVILPQQQTETAEIKRLDKSRICDLPGRQRYIEDIVKTFKAGNRAQVAFLSIQNFKEEFNDVGAELDNVAGSSILGHEFGDYGIQAMAVLLPQMINDLLESFEYKDISFRVYNDAKSYWVVFENIPEDFDPALIFTKMFEEYSDFRSEVVTSVKIKVKQKIEHLVAVGELSQEQQGTILLRLAQMSWRNFNIYAGISSALQAKSTNTADAVTAAEQVDSEATLMAKFEQIGLGKEKLSRMIAQNLEEKDLRTSIIAYVNDARKEQVSRVGVYDQSINADVEIHKKYGQKGEWEPMYRPVGLTYDENATFEKLFSAYDSAQASGNSARISQSKEDIYKKISFAALDPSVSQRAKRPVFSGNERFAEIINYIILEQPLESWTGTFRVGGDEFGKVLWDSETKELFVLRFDINNLGKVNIQWGVSVGDKVIDDMSILFDQIEDSAQLMEKVYNYFNKDFPASERLELEDDDFVYIKEKLKNAGKNVGEYIETDQQNKHFSKRVPPVTVDIVNENNEVVGTYESTPAVSVGAVRIDTKIIQDQKKSGQNIQRDYSEIQGRADRAAERVKTFLKDSQSGNNGIITALNFRTANELMRADNYSPRDLKSFKEYDMTSLQKEIALFIFKQGLVKTLSQADQDNLFFGKLLDSLEANCLTTNKLRIIGSAI